MIQSKFIKTKPGKFQFKILGTNTNVKVNLFLDRNKVEKSQKVVLHGISTENMPRFKTDIENIFSNREV